jgi:LPS export ABC transporter protein LptC
LRSWRFIFIFTSFLLFETVLLFSCRKAPESNMSFEAPEDAPVMSAHTINLLFSDCGKIEARLVSPLMNRYEGESPYLEFPEGFKIYMFDSLQQISTTITGNRGIRRENARTMEAWGKVVVRNEKKNEQIDTEHLIWDENRHKIWSDVKVKITRPDQVLFGNRMESNETFTNYSIQDPVGEMAIKKDSI